MSSVDRRLQNIQDELRSERQQLRKRQDEVGKISTELKQVGRDEVDQILGARETDCLQLYMFLGHIGSRKSIEQPCLTFYST